jgi:hypothetical protein
MELTLLSEPFEAMAKVSMFEPSSPKRNFFVIDVLPMPAKGNGDPVMLVRLPLAQTL